MFNSNQLFKDRLQEHMMLLNRYLRYIFNGHFMIALLFMIITVAIYYQQWLEQLSPSFPATIVLALMFGIVASYNPIQTFLKEPDKVFLLVKEEQMQPYFHRGLLYNFIFQLYIVLIISAAAAPLFMQVFSNKTMKDFLVLVVILLLLKGWNMLTNWYMFKIQHIGIRRLDRLIRSLITIMIFYFLLESSLFVIAVIFLYFALACNNYILVRRQAGLAWEILIENDRNRLASFYRFVSMFANVPHLAKRLKKRPLLSKLINRQVPFAHKATFSYLYRLSFIRSGDYLSMYIRLTILGCVAIYFIPNSWLKIAFVLLVLYMTSFQMIALFQHYRTSIWLDLYPIKQEMRIRTFLSFMYRITIIQTAIFSIMFILLAQYGYFVIALLGGLLFNYVFTKYYINQRLQTT